MPFQQKRGLRLHKITTWLKPLLSKSPDLCNWHSRQSQYGPELKYTLTTIKVWSYYSVVWGFGPTHPPPTTPGHRVHRARLLADGSGSYFWIPQLCYARPLLRRTPQELSVSRAHAYVCLSGRPLVKPITEAVNWDPTPLPEDRSRPRSGSHSQRKP